MSRQPPQPQAGGRPLDPALIEGLAELDLNRRQRLGLAEAVWGEDKSAAQIAAILERLAAVDSERLAGAAAEIILVTRVSAEKAAAVLSSLQRRRLPLALHHHPEARCLSLGALPGSEQPSSEPAATGGAPVAILCGGSSDLVVAQEALLALRCHDIGADLVVDVGIAGLHRLLGKLERLSRARVLIACAGMEGALPTVLAGLLPQPVIGVPISVGYGVSAAGTAALHGMLASCAPGLTVVNIDNGYGAAMAALRILRAVNPEE
ncbi:MAG: nickel pincer cofactor biosynthesis protein LarB [Cyanobium sp.]|nr:MAG: nickel pincer cofactor biosynthesis protein LarB [Cyanobium sp.]